MKFFKQVFAIFLMVFMISCAADSKETVVSKKTISKTAPVSTRSQSPISSNQTEVAGKGDLQSTPTIQQEAASKGTLKSTPKMPRANANNTAQSNKSSKPKARYSVGTANHLGGKLGGKLCNCLKGEDATKCAEINQRIKDVKQSMNPEILTIFEKAFNATKEEC